MLCIFCNTEALCFLTACSNIECLPSESTVSCKIFRITIVKKALQGAFESSWSIDTECFKEVNFSRDTQAVPENTPMQLSKCL